MQIQTCRLIGQQSLAEFKGLHLDLEGVYERNKIRIDSIKKDAKCHDAQLFKVNAGMLVNICDNPTVKEINRKR